MSSRTERSSSSTPTSTASTDYTSLPSPTSSDGSQTQGGGHYRGITFDDILPAHKITKAPPPGPDGGQPASSSSTAAAAERHSTTTMEQQARSPTKRNYPSGKKLSISAGGGRMRATARMLVRGLSKMKRRNSRGGYEAV